MYERFTDRTRKLMQQAYAINRRLDHKWVHAEHMLQALLMGRDGLAGVILGDLNVDPARARQAFTAAVRSPTYEGPDRPPTGKRIIENAIQEARGLGHNYVGTEHILLALLRETDGPTASVWKALGLTYEAIRERVVARSKPPGADQAP